MIHSPNVAGEGLINRLPKRHEKANKPPQHLGHRDFGGCIALLFQVKLPSAQQGTSCSLVLLASDLSCQCLEHAELHQLLLSSPRQHRTLSAMPTLPPSRHCLPCSGP